MLLDLGLPDAARARLENLDLVHDLERQLVALNKPVRPDALQRARLALIATSAE